jgi:DedD protein
MANSAVEPDFDLKKRLVGAFVLIGFGVVVLPALLGGKGLQSGDGEFSVTPRMDSKVFVSKITPIGGATPQRIPAPVETKIENTVAENPTAAPVAPVDTGTSDNQVALIQGTKKPKSEPKPEPKPKLVAATGEPGWVVRIGTFAKDGNVERVITRLQQAGFDPSTTKVKTQKGSVTRVWIGPYAKRVEAARMRTRVQQVTGGEGYIAAYP